MKGLGFSFVTLLVVILLLAVSLFQFSPESRYMKVTRIPNFLSAGQSIAYNPGIEITYGGLAKQVYTVSIRLQESERYDRWSDIFPF
jgi:hypothetical protein